MDRARQEWLKDRTRRFAQGVVENLELAWQDWVEDLTQEEFVLCCDEVEKIAKRIGRTRTYVSSVKADEVT